SFRAWDHSAGSNGGMAITSTHGGSTAFSDNVDQVALTVVSTSGGNLTTGNDSVYSLSGTNTINGTMGAGATLNAGDSLTGGSGADTLVLTGGSTINLNTTPGTFTGFENLTLDNSAYTLTVPTGLTVSLGTSVTSITANGVGTDTVNAAALANNTALTLAGSAAEIVT